MPIDKEDRYYYQIMKEAVYAPDQEITSGYITAMAKAYFKDGNPDKAFEFFQTNL